MVIAHNISLRYSKKEPLVLNNISATFPSGRITFLLGKSGAGKTTLLRCLVGLENPLHGSITIHEKDILKLSPSERAQKISFVFQQYNLFPHMTILENCIQPMVLNKFATASQAEHNALHHLKQVGIEALANRYPSQLSGGQQQRAALARGLCLKPKVLVLDEPTSALDPISTSSFQLLLQNLIAQENLALIISSHDKAFITHMLDRAYLIENGSISECFDKKETTKNPAKVIEYLNL